MTFRKLAERAPGVDPSAGYLAPCPRCGDVVVTGDAPGVDTYAFEAARERGLVVGRFYAPWAVHKHAAGPMRNGAVVEGAERMIAFPDLEHSPGTHNAMRLAHEAGISVQEIRVGAWDEIG